jgi:hypothetical protein
MNRINHLAGLVAALTMAVVSVPAGAADSAGVSCHKIKATGFGRDQGGASGKRASVVAACSMEPRLGTS